MGLFRVTLQPFLKVSRWDTGGTALILKEEEPFGGHFGKIKASGKDSPEKLRYSWADQKADAETGKIC
jgi:hypothetical protein